MIELHKTTRMDLSDGLSKKCASVARKRSSSSNDSSSVASSSSFAISNDACSLVGADSKDRNDNLPKLAQSLQNHIYNSTTISNSNETSSMANATETWLQTSINKKQNDSYHSSPLVNQFFHHHYHSVLSTISKRSKPIRLPNGYELTEWDITSGRGKGSYNRLANQRFRSITESFLPQYHQCSNKIEKSALFDRIVTEITEGTRSWPSPSSTKSSSTKSSSAPRKPKSDNDTKDGVVRFVKYNEEEQCWYEMSADQARDKVGRAMRVAAATGTSTATLKKMMRDSPKNSHSSGSSDTEHHSSDRGEKTAMTGASADDDDVSVLTTNTDIPMTDYQSNIQTDVTNSPFHHIQNSSTSPLTFLQQKENEFLQRQLYLLRCMKEQQQTQQQQHQENQIQPGEI